MAGVGSSPFTSVGVSLLGSEGAGSTGRGASTGVASTIGVSGGDAFASFNLAASRFFSSVLKKTLIVVRRDLFGLQSSAETGACSKTGHEEGRVDWPGTCIRIGSFERIALAHLQDSQIAWSQQGSRNALTASLLQMAHRSLMGISSWVRELCLC